MGKPETAQTEEQKLKALWKAYQKDGDAEARRKLILHFSYLVKYVAGRIMIYMPPYLEMDDLVSYGTIGLIDAVEGFNPDQGVKFSTYAISRIKGAIYDALRAMDWVPRSVREKMKNISQTMNILQQELQRAPSDEELAAAMGISVEKLTEMLAQVTVPQILSLDNVFQGEEGSDRGSMEVPGPKEDNPLAIVQKRDMKEVLAKAIERLPEQEKMVTVLYYYEGLTLREIGEVLDLSAARISQLHTKGILRLRGMLSRDKQNLI